MLPFYIVHVFADEGTYSGNPLAVFVVNPEMEAAEMQQIARQINMSETSFICGQDAQTGCHIARTFTPKGEIPFAGHPALGTAYVIQQFLQKNNDPISLNLPAGRVQLTQGSHGAMWMEMLPASFGEELAVEAIAPVLGLARTVFDPQKPIQIVSTGLPFVIVPLMHLDAVKQASVNLINYNRLISEIPAKAFFIFSPQTYNRDNHYNGRVFGHYYGVPEDTASGSANGSLAAWLLKHGSQETVDVKVEQGYEIDRPSILHIQAKYADDAYQVKVGGQVNLIAKGEWLA